MHSRNDDVGRSKAEHWIRKGVNRTVIKALWEIEVELAGALDEVKISKEAREFLLSEINRSAQILKNPVVRDRLTASAWHRRAQQ
jgi:hypothetical protein